MCTKWHHTTLQFSISPSSKQPSRKSNCNLQIILKKGTGGERMSLHSLMGISHDSTWWPDPSSRELLFGRKPQTTLPSSRSTLKSRHPDNDLHQEANQRQQEKQAVFYDRRAGSDKRPLNNQEPVFLWNALKRTWQPATGLKRPQPTECPRTYTVDI